MMDTYHRFVPASEDCYTIIACTRRTEFGIPCSGWVREEQESFSGFHGRKQFATLVSNYNG